jgi:hypothetical protein
MRLLVDSDVFCKLGAADLFEPAAEVLGVGLADCARLRALPHMLRRGSLRRRVGDAQCDALLPLALQLPAIPVPPAAWLDLLAPLPAVDPGEAQLLACAAERDVLVMTSDKRALRAVKDVPGFADALRGKVVLLDVLLLELCMRHGDEVIRHALRASVSIDTMIAVAFSPDNRTPREALRSYVASSVGELSPLTVWTPAVGGAP